MVVALMCASAVAAVDAGDFDGLVIEQPDNININDIDIAQNSNADIDIVQADDININDIDIDQKDLEIIANDNEIQNEEANVLSECKEMKDAKIATADDIKANETIAPELSRYDKIIKFLNKDFEGIDQDDFLVTMKVYDELLGLYGAGHSVKSIAAEVNMTPEQVQTIADSNYGEIKDDEIANGVYKLYGSHTLDEIADKLGVTNHTVLKKVQMIKNGKYGKTYKRLFLVRDLISTSDDVKEFIIN